MKIISPASRERVSRSSLLTDGGGVVAAAGFTTMCVEHIPSPAHNAHTKVDHIYTGPLDTDVAQAMHDCNSEVSRLFNSI